ncbi:MAG: phosphoglycerate kinase [Candidatus Hydrothermota bacterium]|nr:MAG: phosphoglycerate kinase [Candidatus Hydrothermae bacterium]
MKKLTILDLEDSFFKGKRVFVRVDFNVPIKDGKIQDDTRIRKALPTITYLLDREARVILASHLGRPKGERKPELSLRPVAEHLSKILKKEVKFVDDCVGNKVQNAVRALKNGEVILLENLRFYTEETKNDENFSRQLAALCDVYVNDAFGTAHRKHASTYGMAQFVEKRVAGILIKRELEALTKVRENPEKPFVVVLGGAKVKDKIEIIENLLPKADRFLIGGGMAYTFLKARGSSIGNSILDEESLNKVSEFLKSEKILLPIDHVAVSEISENAEIKIIKGDIEEGLIGVDIGPETLKLYTENIPDHGTLFWNGPMGVFEIDKFSKGSIGIAQAIKEATSKGLYTVIGGGDTVSAIHKAGLEDEDFSHVSTGGGATLEFLAGINLPGIEMLEDK